MKRLLVLRHAKASQESPSGGDFDRPLTDRGRRAAAAVGGALRDGGRRVDAILASPAARVAQTVEGLSAAAGLSIAPAWDRRLYNASAEALLAAIAETGEAVEALLVVGHNPGLPQMILALARDDGAARRARVADGFPTATLAELHLAVDRWRDVAPGSGMVVAVERPGD